MYSYVCSCPPPVVAGVPKEGYVYKCVARRTAIYVQVCLYSCVYMVVFVCRHACSREGFVSQTNYMICKLVVSGVLVQVFVIDTVES
jgi:hypothetical protein